MKKAGRFILVLISISMTCLMLASCMKKEASSDSGSALDGTGLSVIPQDTILYKQNPTVSEEILDDLREQEMDLVSFCTKHHLSGCKIVNNGPYLVLNTDQAIYYVAFSTDLEESTIFEVHFSASAHKADVEKLAVGMTLQDALAADPDGQYTVNTRWKAHYEDGFSLHYFEDGDCFLIGYESGTITLIIPFTL